LYLNVCSTNVVAKNLAFNSCCFTFLRVGFERSVTDLTSLSPSFLCPESGVNEMGRWN
jgi:hypothetical protein